MHGESLCYKTTQCFLHLIPSSEPVQSPRTYASKNWAHCHWVGPKQRCEMGEKRGRPYSPSRISVLVIPARRVTIKKKQMRLLIAVSFLALFPLYKVGAVVKKRILRHAAIFGCTDAESTRISPFKKLFWACIWVG